MRLRLTVVLPTVLPVAILLPAGTPATAAVPTNTVVDAIEGLPPNDGVRAQSFATVTEPIRAPITFSLLAFTAPAGATVAYRTATDGDTWGAWTHAEGGDDAVWLASAFRLTPQGTDHFTDDDGSDSEWAINALADAGLTVGCTEDTYCPEDATSRGQMASFLSRAIDQLESSGLAG